MITKPILVAQWISVKTNSEWVRKIFYKAHFSLAWAHNYLVLAYLSLVFCRLLSLTTVSLRGSAADSIRLRVFLGEFSLFSLPISSTKFEGSFTEVLLSLEAAILRRARLTTGSSLWRIKIHYKIHYKFFWNYTFIYGMPTFHNITCPWNKYIGNYNNYKYNGNCKRE